MTKELSILRIMKQHKCDWEAACKKENEKRSLKEFI